MLAERRTDGALGDVQMLSNIAAQTVTPPSQDAREPSERARSTLIDESVLTSCASVSFTFGMLRHDHAFKQISNPKTDFGVGLNWDIFDKFNCRQSLTACHRTGSVLFSSIAARV